MSKLIPLTALMIPLLAACGGASTATEVETTPDGWRIFDDEYELKVTRAPEEPPSEAEEAEGELPTPPPEETISARPE